jgi:hypothetical protein
MIHLAYKISGEGDWKVKHGGDSGGNPNTRKLNVVCSNLKAQNVGIDPIYKEFTQYGARVIGSLPEQPAHGLLLDGGRRKLVPPPSKAWTLTTHPA